MLWVSCSWFVYWAVYTARLPAFPGCHDPPLWKEPAFPFLQTACLSTSLLNHLNHLNHQLPINSTQFYFVWSLSAGYFISKNSRHPKPDPTPMHYPPANLSQSEPRGLHSLVQTEKIGHSRNWQDYRFIAEWPEAHNYHWKCIPGRVWYTGSRGFDLQYKKRSPAEKEPAEIWTWSFCHSASFHKGFGRTRQSFLAIVTAARNSQILL